MKPKGMGILGWVLAALAVTTVVQAEQVIRVPADEANLQTAFDTISDGGIIEGAAGVYPAPAGGFLITDPGRGFTVRGPASGVAALDGGGSGIVLRYAAVNPVSPGPVLFENLTFRNGVSTTDGNVGGVTVSDAEATFIGLYVRGQRRQPTWQQHWRWWCRPVQRCRGVLRRLFVGRQLGNQRRGRHANRPRLDRLRP